VINGSSGSVLGGATAGPASLAAGAGQLHVPGRPAPPVREFAASSRQDHHTPNLFDRLRQYTALAALLSAVALVLVTRPWRFLAGKRGSSGR
jgi:hypothetical protein